MPFGHGNSSHSAKRLLDVILHPLCGHGKEDFLLFGRVDISESFQKKGFVPGLVDVGEPSEVGLA